MYTGVHITATPRQCPLFGNFLIMSDTSIEAPASDAPSRAPLPAKPGAPIMTDEKSRRRPDPPPVPPPIPTRKTPPTGADSAPCRLSERPSVDGRTLTPAPLAKKYAHENTYALTHRPTSTQPQPLNAFKKSLDSRRSTTGTINSTAPSPSSTTWPATASAAKSTPTATPSPIRSSPASSTPTTGSSKNSPTTTAT